jgi:hypothetical protein
VNVGQRCVVVDMDRHPQLNGRIVEIVAALGHLERGAQIQVGPTFALTSVTDDWYMVRSLGSRFTIETLFSIWLTLDELPLPRCRLRPLVDVPEEELVEELTV